jgi:serine protease AprX
MRQIFLRHQEGNPGVTLYALLRCGIILLVSVALTSSPAMTQETFEQTAPAKYRIVFTDKDNSPYSIEAPGDFLSQKALERRQNQEIPISFNDLPVTPAYIDSLINAGAEILTVSKWFNAATVKVFDDLTLNKIAKLTFVKKDVVPESSAGKRLIITEDQIGMQEITTSAALDYGPSWWQTAIHNGHLMHNRGYTGKDIAIAVIDAGFAHVDVLPAFKDLREKGQILGTRDFVSAGSNVYLGSGHGMSVLSIIGGYLPGELIGTAPDADFWLLRSEDVASEYIIEEDNWIAAAEFADSAGADIINTSLGYSVFNDTSQNHTYADLDGNTTRISRAADLAASKGMLVVVSAGNQGSSAWKYITAPADADSVLTVGAIDQSRYVASFSSRGPSSDGQVKPDVMAIGKGTFVANLDGTIKQGSGTSYSAPLITGLAACLWQANPHATAMELLQAICESANRFTQPNDDYGYGIPDFNLAHTLLQTNLENETDTEPVIVFPNPFNNQLYIIFKSAIDVPVYISLYDLTGNELIRALFPPVAGRSYVKLEGLFDNLPKGAYLIKIDGGDMSGNSKLIKF